MLNIAIVEDEKEWQQTYRQFFNRYISETHEAISVRVFGNGMDFISDYHGGYDIIIMDIAMPHMDGLESAKRLRKADTEVCLIFITTLSQYAINGYEVGAYDFIVKPVTYELFKQKIDKAVSYMTKKRKACFPVTHAGGCSMLPLAKITYVESVKHYLYIHTATDVLKMRGVLGDVKDFFVTNGFAASNRSVLINLVYVEGYDGSSVIVSGESIPLSRIYRAEFLGRLAQFVGGGV